VDNCRFKNNVLLDSSETRNSGLIFSELGGDVEVQNSLFFNNQVNTSYLYDWYGLNGAITAVDIEGKIEIDTKIDVRDSCFIHTRGISYSPVLGSVWSDGALTQSNNYAVGNAFVQEKKCDGIGRLLMNPYYFYYGYYNFSTALCQEQFTASSCAQFPEYTAATTASNSKTSSGSILVTFVMAPVLTVVALGLLF